MTTCIVTPVGILLMTEWLKLGAGKALLAFQLTTCRFFVLFSWPQFSVTNSYYITSCKLSEIDPRYFEAVGNPYSVSVSRVFVSYAGVSIDAFKLRVVDC